MKSWGLRTQVQADLLQRKRVGWQVTIQAFVTSIKGPGLVLNLGLLVLGIVGLREIAEICTQNLVSSALSKVD